MITVQLYHRECTSTKKIMPFGSEIKHRNYMEVKEASKD